MAEPICGSGLVLTASGSRWWSRPGSRGGGESALGSRWRSCGVGLVVVRSCLGFGIWVGWWSRPEVVWCGVGLAGVVWIEEGGGVVWAGEEKGRRKEK
uniref:Uncharacterized protein n=1 Tax=Fagus sylvatica TaxID=28930 RepID=A0A2N9I4V1_FAGSY